MFAIALEPCPHGGGLKIIAEILDQPVVRNILTHLNLKAGAPPRPPGRVSLQQAA